jgi:hypothetical protein
MLRSFLGSAVLLLPAVVLAAGPPARSAGPDFDRVIAPLLARHCLACHGGSKPRGGLDLRSRKSTLAGGDQGPALVPGQPDASPLLERIVAREMPPKKTVPPAEQALLRAWIAAGAPWGSDPIDPHRLSTHQSAGLDWWSLQPVRRPAIPPVKDSVWLANPLDAFVLARLEATGLSPSPRADRRILIRRLTLDLLGLPPTPEEVDAFQKDTAPDAWPRLVDRLLASPHAGERQARRWLDVVRFGESDGFERDLPRFNAWPYRDWVIRAFNADLPYDRFVRLQLAGDVLEPGDPSALAATGFLVAGPHDVVVPVSKAMRDTMRQDELEDLIGTVGQTFLGLTVHCARCHDHKFDPVSQKDYYRLVSALAGAGHGERGLVDPADQRRLAHLQQQSESLTRRITDLENPVRAAILAGRPSGKGPRPLAEWDFRQGLEDRLGKLHGTLHGSARRDDEGLHLDGKTGYVATAPLTTRLKEKTLEVEVKLADLKQRGGGVLSVQTNDGQVFDAIVFGEQQPGHWLAGSNFFQRTRPFNGPAETEAGRRTVHLALTYAADGTITAYREGVPYGTAYRAASPVVFAPSRAQVVFGLRHSPAGGNKMLAGTIVRARLHARALSPDEVALSAGTLIPEAEIVDRLSPSQREQRRAWRQQRAGLQDEIRALEARRERKLYAVVPFQPEPTYVLKRGNVLDRGELVAAEPISALTNHTPLPAVAPEAPEGERRRRLAEWISSPRNPLIARVIVNRLWQWHFGVGLVETSNDLGFHGGQPSHPELLDWMAGELIRSGWSLKHLQRLIVTSSTYRQSSAFRPEAARLDADNRLLWRHTPQRLDAEAVRDCALAVSDRLERTLGGPPYQDFRTFFFKGTQFYEPVEQVGPTFARRTVYRMSARGGRNPFLDTFDCPDPSTTTPRRAATTTPLQALALWNNALVFDLAESLAKRARREAGPDLDAQLDRVFLLAYTRRPDPRERALIRPFVQRHGLPALCRVLLNSNEFLQVE